MFDVLKKQAIEKCLNVFFWAISVIVLCTSTAAYAQNTPADSVSETGTAVRFTTPASCQASLADLSDGVITTVGICLIPEPAPTYTINFDFPPTGGPTEYMSGITIWANAGNNRDDGELRILDVDVDYFDPGTGTTQTLTVNDFNIGDTLGAVSPFLDPKFVPFGQDLFRVSQVRIRELRGRSDGADGGRFDGRVVFREVQGLYVPAPTEPEIDIDSSEGGAIADNGTDAHGNEPAGTPKTVTYTVNNTGTAPLTLTGTPTVSGLTNITGTPTVSAPSSGTVAPGSSATFTVTYTPTAAGPFSFDIDVVNNDADENPYDIAVSGTATTGPEIDVSSSEGGAIADAGTDAHGNEPIGTPKTVTYTINNTGTAPLNLTGPPTVSGLTNITGTPTVGSLSTPTVAPGSSATFTVTYTPTAAGPFSFDVDIPNDDADENPYDIAVTGTATADPEIGVSSSEGGVIADGGADAHGTEPFGVPNTVTYSITNTGTTPLNLTAPPTVTGLTNITGTPTVGPLSSPTVAPGATETFTVTYTPTAPGPFSFDVTIPNDDADEGPYNIAASGTANADPEIGVVSSQSGAVSDGGADPHGNEVFGTPVTVVYTISNTGTTPLNLTGTPTVTGLTNITGTPTVGPLSSPTVAPGGTATFAVTYIPTAAGPFGFDVTIPNDDADEGPYNIAASGTAVAAPPPPPTEPEIGIISSIGGAVSDGGTDPQGTPSAGTPVTVTYTINNTGNETLILTGPPTISGATNISGTPTVGTLSAPTVAPGGSATFTVTYTPAGTGPFGFDITVPNNDADESPYNIAATGTVAATGEIDVSSSVSGAIPDGGSDPQGNAPAGTPTTITYTVTNTGTGPLNLTGPPTVSGLSNITGTPTVGPLSATSLAPGSSATFTVTYTPTDAGAFGFDVTIPNDDADENPYNIAVAGTSVADVDIAISSSTSGEIADGGADPQGSQPTDDPVTITYTVRNDGIGTLTLGGTPTVSNLNNVESGIVVSAPGALALDAGESTTFTVTYTPIAEGPFSFDIDVASDDPDENPYDIAVSGAGNAPPTVVLTGPSGPQNGPFTVTATFSEPVTNLTLSDFDIGNGTGSNFVQVAPDVYTIVITPNAPDATVTISLPQDIAVDADNGPNRASNMLRIAGTALTADQREEIRGIIIDQEIRNIRTQIRTNQRAIREARDRHINHMKCRAPRNDPEVTLPLDDLDAHECDFEEKDVPLSFDGKFSANDTGATMDGSFFGKTMSHDGTRRRLVFGDLDVTRADNDDVTVSLNGRIAWERLVSDDVLLGYFLGANASRTNLNGNFEGKHTGYGVSAGAYFVDQLSTNLFWDGFVALGLGRNNLDVGDGTVDVGSDYNTRSVQFGLAISGVREYTSFEVRPELSLAYGYSDIGEVDLDVTNVSGSFADLVNAGNVSLGTIRFTPEVIIPLNTGGGVYDSSEFRILPSIACEYLKATTSSSDCGGGLELEWSAQSDDGLREFSARIGRDVIGGDKRDSIGLRYRREF